MRQVKNFAHKKTSTKPRKLLILYVHASCFYLMSLKTLVPLVTNATPLIDTQILHMICLHVDSELFCYK